MESVTKEEEEGDETMKSSITAADEEIGKKYGWESCPSINKQTVEKKKMRKTCGRRTKVVALKNHQ